MESNESQIKKKLKANSVELTRKQKTISLSIATMLTTVISTIMAMIMARVFSKVELSAYKQTFLAYQTLAPILSLGISQGIFYLLARNSAQKRKIVRKCLIVLTAMGVLYSAFFLFGGNRILAERFNNPQIEILLLLLMPYAIIMIPASIISPILISENKIKINANFSVLSQLIIAMGILVSILLWHSPQIAITSTVILNVLIYGSAIIYLYSSLPTDSNNDKPVSIKEILIFSLPLGISSMIGTIDQQLDRWLVSLMYSPEQFAVFSNGAFEIPFIGAITAAISAVIIVDLNKYINDNDFNSALVLFKKGAIVASKILLPLFVFFLVVAKPFIVFLYTDRYIAAVPIFQVYLLLLPVRTVFYGPLLIALGKSKQILYNSIILLIADSIISYILVKYFGPLGASLATVIAIYTVHIPLNYRLISKEMKIFWFQILPFKEMMICLSLTILPGIFCYVTDYLSNDYQIFIRLLLDGLVFFSITFLTFSFYYKWPVKMIILKYFAKIANIIK